MVKQLGNHTAVVTLQELGTNCWAPRRFIENGSRCCRIYVCIYPERKNCWAVHAEIKHLKQEQVRMATVIGTIDRTVEKLCKMLEK